MTPPFHLTAADYDIIIGLLRQHIPDYEVWAFGSRVSGEHLKPFSDLDLTIIDTTPLPHQALDALKEALIESDTAIRVDISCHSNLPHWLQQDISTRHEVVQQGAT